MRTEAGIARQDHQGAQGTRMLESDILGLVAAGASASKEAMREAFARLREALSAGTVRAAEPDSSSPFGWRVNTWVKQGILLGFRSGDNVDVSGDHGRWPFYDKDTLPMKKPGLAAGIRIVPGGSSVRDGAYIAPGVICMPPMFVNIGAYIGEQTLVDSHALVGSCAQIGARVHVSAAAQIGGVIEPVGALPVIIEDDALIGGNTGIYEGAVIKARAVVGAGTVLTGSTPVYDLVRGEIIRPTANCPLVIPEGAVVVPGARAVTVGKGPEWGLSLATPVIVKYRDSRTDTRTELEAWIR
jgi:2,3,4,5-tetrahydropyridine-2-carboxylate N-succinyltransferase